MKIWIMMGLMLLMGELQPLQAQSTMQSIQSDIKIMESILDKLFRNSSDGFLLASRSRGYYLDGYGVLFKIPYDISSRSISSWVNDVTDNFVFVTSGKKLTRKIEMNLRNPFGQRDSLLSAQLPEIRKTVTRFMGDYCSVINGLKPDNRVIVIVDFNSQFPWKAYGGSGTQLRELVAKARVRDLKEFRVGKLDEAGLARKIEFKELRGDNESGDRDIDVFEDIIRSAVKKDSEYNFRIDDNVNGFYLNGYGAVFMVNTQFLPKKFQVFTNTSKGEEENEIVIQNWLSQVKESRKIVDDMEALQNKLIEVMSRFGHTLRRLQQNEWLELAVTIDEHDPDQDFSTLIMRIQKNDLLRYGGQDVKNLRKRIQILKY